MQLSFIKENCQRLMTVLTSLEAKNTPLACSTYNTLEDLSSYLQAGTTKISFGNETDQLLGRLGQPERNKAIKSFQKVFQMSFEKLDSHLKRHPAYSYYKAARVFDPRQLSCISSDIGDYVIIRGLANPAPELMEEWLIYSRFQPDRYPTLVELPSFWTAMAGRFPLLSEIASDAIWLPVTSVDVERSFSQYKYLLNERRESLTDENTRRLMMLYYNGDIEQRFK